MALNSFKFLIYFAALFAVLVCLEIVKKFVGGKRLAKAQTTIMLLFGYVLIGAADLRFLACVIFTTGTTYASGILIQKKKARRIWLAAGIAVPVLLLGYFKYTNFFISGICTLFGVAPTSLDIILPVGISFYTFSAVAYLIDVYRGKYDAVTNVCDFALYISFFPKMVSGPIVRGDVFFPQVREYRGIRGKHVSEGVQIFVFGLFKKAVLADHLGLFVDNVYSAPDAYSTASVILAVISYSLQIYFDFSGYSDMAIGISKAVGFDFDKNFDLPYISKGFSEFWRRWHISLSSWFRDYLYFPLGGSRGTAVRTCVNLVIVMAVSGLWHGAGATFILWGLLYGLVSCAEHLLSGKEGKRDSVVMKVVKTACTFIAVTLFWIPFRASSFSNMLDILKGCFTIRDGIWHPYAWTYFAIACLAGATLFAVIKSRRDGVTDKRGNSSVRGYYPILDLSRFIPLCIFFIFCGLTIILAYFGNTAFIYGKF